MTEVVGAVVALPLVDDGAKGGRFGAALRVFLEVGEHFGVAVDQAVEEFWVESPSVLVVRTGVEGLAGDGDQRFQIELVAVDRHVRIFGLILADSVPNVNCIHLTMKTDRPQCLSRRDFLTSSAAASATGAMALPAFGAPAGGSDKLRFAMIGCGSRGTSDARDFLCSSDGVELVAMAEMFQDRIDDSLAKLKDPKYFGDRWKKAVGKVKVTPETCFTGFDAYKKVLAMGDVDVLLLLTPPGFRPEQMRAAVEAGKHVFMEKPAAVDSTGIRSVLESGKMASAKGLSVVVGMQQRKMPHYVEIMKRVADGQIGKVCALSTAWHWDNMFWHFEKRKPEWTDMEWQLRCWPYFTWLSGDHVVEQHVHNLDVMNWAMGGPPKEVLARGGRQTRTGAEFGNIFDHFGAEFVYDNGVRMYSYASQILGATGRIYERITGATGEVSLDRSGGKITGEKPYTFEGKTHNGGEEQFRVLVDAIRNNEPVNETERVANATMTGILARMSAYSGRAVSWNFAMKGSKEDLQPAAYKLGDLPVRPVAIPGKSKLV